MPTLLPDMSLPQWQFFIKEVYEVPNNRHFESGEMLDHIQRFAMRGLKGIRKKDIIQIRKNLIISLSFFTSLMNRLQINIEEEMWRRFPYVCSYCGKSPCVCKEIKPNKRQEISVDNSKKPKTLNEFQMMFNMVYPPSSRIIEHAGVHLAEELGEFSEVIWAYRASKSEEDFEKVKIEAADYLSCLIGVFNSLNLNLAEEITKFYPKNCHACGNSPCTCSYDIIKNYKINYAPS